MKKRIISLCIALGMVVSLVPQTVFAYAVPDMVSVGLESIAKNKTTITVNGTTFLVGTLKNGKFSEGGEIKSSGEFRATVADQSYIAIDEKMTYDDAYDMAESLERMGLDASVSYLSGENWTVYVSNSSRSEVESQSKENASKVSGFVGVVVDGGNVPVILAQGSDCVLQGTQRDDTFVMGDSQYRGYLSFAVNSGALTAVNTIDLEEYLYGVVSSEMPSTYELEALKAQAVAARTYAMTKLAAHTASGYQLCDTTACQVYKGYTWEKTSTTKAIDETEGVIVCYNGQPIEAVFSASTGGYTENSENVWNAPFGYLKAVPEIAEYGDNTWTITLTLAELNALVATKGETIGTVTDIKITKLSTGGRVQELQIVGTAGTKTLTKEAIRTYFSGTASGSLPGKMFTINGKGGEIGVYGQTGGASSNSGNGSLLAAAANGGIKLKTEGNLSSINGKSVDVDADSSRAKTKTSTSTNTNSNAGYEVYSTSISTVDKTGKFVFEGVGRGHGVGLSQKGAQAMAQSGYKYDAILKHYYTDVTLEES